MKRKNYQKPTMQVFKLQHRPLLQETSVVEAKRSSYGSAQVEEWN